MGADEWLHKVRANSTCGLCKWPHTLPRISFLLNFSCADYRHGTPGWRSNPIGPRSKHGSSILQGSRVCWRVSCWKNPYKGPDEHQVKWQWKSCREWFSAQATAHFRADGSALLTFKGLIKMPSGQWVDYHERTVVQVRHTKQSLSTLATSTRERWSHAGPLWTPMKRSKESSV